MTGPFGDYSYEADGEGATQYTVLTHEVVDDIIQWIEDGLDETSEGAVTYLANPSVDAYAPQPALAS